MSRSWKSITITRERSISEALEVIDRGAIRTALVVGDNNELIGVISDGDIRRGLLAGITLDSSVMDVVNRNPITVESSTPAGIADGLLKERDILAIPVLEQDIVVGLITRHSDRKKRELENPVFLMAGGFGTRLRPLTNDVPKPLLTLDDRPILEIILLSFINAGFINFYISTHFMPHKIREYFGDGSDWGVKICYVHESEPLGTGGALSLLPDNIPNLPMILMNGDLLTTVDFTALLDFHNDYSPTATMCVREYEHQIPFGVVEVDGKRLVSMTEKPTKRYFTNAGIYVLDPEFRNYAEPGIKVDLPTLLEKSIGAGYEVITYPIYEYWLDIGRFDDFEKAKHDILTLGI